MISAIGSGIRNERDLANVRFRQLPNIFPRYQPAYEPLESPSDSEISLMVAEAGSAHVKL
jgi:hypothetical protein